MTIQRITSSEPLPKIPAVVDDPAELQKYLYDLQNYLMRLMQRAFTDENVSASALPQGSDCDILYHNGSKWTKLSKPGSAGDYVLEISVDSYGNCSLSWASTYD